MSSRVAPAAASAALMFSPTWRICARMSPAPTTSPAGPRASWPDTKMVFLPSTTTTWEYSTWPPTTRLLSESGWMFCRFMGSSRSA